MLLGALFAALVSHAGTVAAGGLSTEPDPGRDRGSMFDQISRPISGGNTDGPARCHISQIIEINGEPACWSDLAGLNWDLGGGEDQPGVRGAGTPMKPIQTPPDAPAPVPLPAGGVLLLGALAGLWGVRRKGGA